MLFSNTYNQLARNSKGLYKEKGSKFIAYAINVKSEEQVVNEIRNIKKIEKKFSNIYPNKWTPLYSMVSFTNIAYADARKIGIKQEKIMQKIMSLPNIEKKWNNDEIMHKINSLL